MTLEQYMKAQGLDDESFGALVGRHRTQILRIRKGDSTPPDPLKEKIAEVTGGDVPVTAWFPALHQGEAA